MGPPRRRWAGAGEVAHVLLEEFVRRTDPPLPEPGPGTHPLVLQFGRPGVRGLLEERRTRLPPQLAAEQEGRIGSQGHLDRGNGLGGVPHIREPFRGHLQMQLDRGAGRLRRDRPGGADQTLHTFDIKGEILAARRHHLVVQQRVAVHVGEVRGDHVRAADRGQYSDHHDPGIDLMRPSGRHIRGRSAALRPADRERGLPDDGEQCSLPD